MTVVSEPIEQQSFEAKSLKVGGVTVYGDRGEVKRAVRATLKAGKNEVLVKNVSQRVDKDSVRVDGRGPAVICEVQYQQKTTKQGEVDHEGIKKLTAEKTVLEKKKLELDDSIKVLTRQGEVFDGVATQVGRGGVTVYDDRGEVKRAVTATLIAGKIEVLGKTS